MGCLLKYFRFDEVTSSMSAIAYPNQLNYSGQNKF